MPPTVSVLVTTYNRSRLLRRAVESVLVQDFTDLELVVLDDASTDDTPDVVASYADPRIRYVRNQTNVGARLGDREHVRRFVYELMRGNYFVYLCDDDYWISPDLLRREVEAFRSHGNVAMVIGGQLSHYVASPNGSTGGPEDDEKVTPESLGAIFDIVARRSTNPHFDYLPNLFSRPFLASQQYLAEFASDPVAKNRIVGATLYSRSHFMRSGAMTCGGSKWQAGYEFLMGPACFGNVVYIDEPAIVTEIRATNASFRRTQLDHYMDSIASVEAAFATPLKIASRDADRRRFLTTTKNAAIHNLSRSFLGNTLSIWRDGSLTMCSPENTASPVTWRHVLPVLWRNGALSQLNRTDAYFFKELTRSSLRRLIRSRRSLASQHDRAAPSKGFQ